MDSPKTKAVKSSMFVQKHKNFKKFMSVLLFSASLLLVACGGDGNSTGPDPEPEPEPEPEPNRLVSFSEDIQPIFNGNCAVSGCHDSGTQESGVNLSSHEAALNSVGVQYGENVINPGNPDQSPLVDKISNNNPQEGVRMPEDGPPYLSDTQIDSIRAWIEDGAPDN